MVDDVLADGVVLLHHYGDLEFGAHAVRGGDEQGVLGTALRKAAEPAERPDAADDICGLRRADQGLDGLERIHLVVDVDAGGGVGGFCGGRGTGHDFFLLAVVSPMKEAKTGEILPNFFSRRNPLDGPEGKMLYSLLDFSAYTRIVVWSCHGNQEK